MANARPLSPHLSVYKREWTMIYSILHRITGFGLYAGMVVFAIWLMALAGGVASFDMAHALLSHFIGRLFLFGWTLAFFYHFANGIRHLFWDFGAGFELETARKSGHFVFFMAILLTVLSWSMAYIIS